MVFCWAVNVEAETRISLIALLVFRNYSIYFTNNNVDYFKEGMKCFREMEHLNSNIHQSVSFYNCTCKASDSDA